MNPESKQKKNAAFQIFLCFWYVYEDPIDVTRINFAHLRTDALALAYLWFYFLVLFDAIDNIISFSILLLTLLEINISLCFEQNCKNQT